MFPSTPRSQHGMKELVPSKFPPEDHVLWKLQDTQEKKTYWILPTLNRRMNSSFWDFSNLLRDSSSWEETMNPPYGEFLFPASPWTGIYEIDSWYNPENGNLCGATTDGTPEKYKYWEPRMYTSLFTCPSHNSNPVPAFTFIWASDQQISISYMTFLHLINPIHFGLVHKTTFKKWTTPFPSNTGAINAWQKTKSIFHLLVWDLSKSTTPRYNHMFWLTTKIYERDAKKLWAHIVP